MNVCTARQKQFHRLLLLCPNGSHERRIVCRRRIDIRSAIQREKTMKKWKRDWKINLIERENRHWCDLYPGLVGEVPSRAYWESKPNCQE